MNTVVRHRNSLKSARGSTLLGLMAGLAVVEISGTALVTAMTQFNKQQVYLDTKTSSSSLTSEMADEFNSLATCTAAIDTSNALVQQGSIWPISMKVPSLPGVLITTGSSQPLGTTGLKMSRLYLDRLSDTGLLGVNGKKLYTGTVIAEFSGTSDGSLSLRSQTVSQLFLEIENSKIVTCASANDPTTALSLACGRVGGVYSLQTKLCSMDRFAQAQVNRAVGEVKQQLYNEYFDRVHNEMSRRIATAADQILTNSVNDANNNTNGAANQLNQSITDNTNSVNGRVTTVNNTLTQNVNDLQSRINAINSLTQNAQNVTNDANNIINQANAVTGQANQHSQTAQAYVDQALAIANQAIATGQQAGAIATDAYNQSVAAYANLNAANTASYQSNVNSVNANNTSFAATNTSNWANGASSSANNYATSSFNTTFQSTSLTSAAIVQSWHAQDEANAGIQNSWASDASVGSANNWYNMWAGRPSYSYQTSSSSTRECDISGPNCAAQL